MYEAPRPHGANAFGLAEQMSHDLLEGRPAIGRYEERTVAAFIQKGRGRSALHVTWIDGANGARGTGLWPMRRGWRMDEVTSYLRVALEGGPGD